MQFLRRLALAAVAGAAVFVSHTTLLDAAEPMRVPGEETLRELGEDHLEAEAIAHECAVYVGSLAERWAAMAELGLQFATGEYLTKDIARAYEWDLLARKYGASVESQLRDLERRLAPAHIARIVEEAKMPGYF